MNESKQQLTKAVIKITATNDNSIKNDIKITTTILKMTVKQLKALFKITAVVLKMIVKKTLFKITVN